MYRRIIVHINKVSCFSLLAALIQKYIKEPLWSIDTLNFFFSNKHFWKVKFFYLSFIKIEQFSFSQIPSSLV